MPLSTADRIGRESTIFGVALASSALQNYAIRYFIGTKQTLRGEYNPSDTYKRNFMRACLSRGGSTYDQCENELENDIGERRDARAINVNSLVKTATANVGIGLFTIFAPAAGSYLAWDLATLKEYKMSSEQAVIPAVTFGILAYLIHTVISTAGRARTHFEVWLYASVYALSVSGLSALMHEFYPIAEASQSDNK